MTTAQPVVKLGETFYNADKDVLLVHTKAGYREIPNPAAVVAMLEENVQLKAKLDKTIEDLWTALAILKNVGNSLSHAQKTVRQDLHDRYQQHKLC